MTSTASFELDRSERTKGEFRGRGQLVGAGRGWGKSGCDLT